MAGNSSADGRESAAACVVHAAEIHKLWVPTLLNKSSSQTRTLIPGWQAAHFPRASQKPPHAKSSNSGKKETNTSSFSRTRDGRRVSHLAFFSSLLRVQRADGMKVNTTVILGTGAGFGGIRGCGQNSNYFV